VVLAKASKLSSKLRFENQFDSVIFLFNPSVISNITNWSVDAIEVSSDIELKLRAPDGLTDDEPPRLAFHSFESYINVPIVPSTVSVKLEAPFMVFPFPSILKLFVVKESNSSYTEIISPVVGLASRYPVRGVVDVSIEYKYPSVIVVKLVKVVLRSPIPPPICFHAASVEIYGFLFVEL